MKNKYFLKLQQTEEIVRPFRAFLDAQPPRGGWIRTIREALGMTSAQLAKRMRIKASQSVEDMQLYEVRGTIKLQTLNKIAQALDCRLVYALVPLKPLDQIRQDRANTVAERQLRHAAHSMNLEAQGVTGPDEAHQLELLVRGLLAGSPKRLWN